MLSQININGVYWAMKRLPPSMCHTTAELIFPRRTTIYLFIISKQCVDAEERSEPAGWSLLRGWRTWQAKLRLEIQQTRRWGEASVCSSLAQRPREASLVMSCSHSFSFFHPPRLHHHRQTEKFTHSRKMSSNRAASREQITIPPNEQNEKQQNRIWKINNKKHIYTWNKKKERANTKVCCSEKCGEKKKKLFSFPKRDDVSAV